MRTRARTRFSCLAVALASMLTACGGDNTSDGATSSSETGARVEAAQTTPAQGDATGFPASSLPVTDGSVAATEPETIAIDTVAPAAITTVVPITPVTAAASNIALPIPVAVPVDSRGEEPIVNLGTIAIPKINLKTDLFEGIRLTTLDRGPGHWPGTAMPGQVGNVVVAGHRVSHDKPFRNVDKLVAGDQVIFTTSDGVFTYSVTSMEIVTPNTLSIIDQTADRTATLFACHPPGSTRERIVVHLALVET